MNFSMFKQFLSGGGTPQQFLSKLPINNNPMLSNLVSMAKSGNSKDIETFARNLFKEKGRDFDKEFSEFRNRLLQ